MTRLGFAILIAFIATVSYQAGAAHVSTQAATTLPPVFAVGHFFQKPGDVDTLYEVKEIRGDWLHVTTWVQGKPLNANMWINAATGQAWNYSPK